MPHTIQVTISDQAYCQLVRAKSAITNSRRRSDPKADRAILADAVEAACERLTDDALQQLQGIPE